VGLEELKPVDETLRASERHLRLVIDSIPALVWSARPGGSAELFNQHYLDNMASPWKRRRTGAGPLPKLAALA
jgi:hypothetical protein